MIDYDSNSMIVGRYDRPLNRPRHIDIEMEDSSSIYSQACRLPWPKWQEDDGKNLEEEIGNRFKFPTDMLYLNIPEKRGETNFVSYAGNLIRNPCSCLLSQYTS